MPRYIDAEALKTYVCSDRCKKYFLDWNGDRCKYCSIHTFLDAIDRHKTADVVEVVRCKDCKHHKDEEPGIVYCPNIIGGWCGDDWFCKSGERRKE